jgi:hypothetical protein
MPDHYFNVPGALDASAPIGPCWYCTWWGGVAPGGVNGLCARPKHMPVTGRPEQGCAYWEREPGVDDIAWQPMLDVPPLKPRA